MKSKQLKMNILLAGFVIITAGIVKNVSAELSKSDVQEIRIIIREELRPIEERISSLDKRIDSLEKRIEDLRAVTLAGFGILFAGMFCMIGFVIWDRRTALKPAINEIEELKKREARLEEVLRKIAYEDPKIASILKSTNLL